MSTVKTMIILKMLLHVNGRWFHMLLSVNSYLLKLINSFGKYEEKIIQQELIKISYYLDLSKLLIK